MASWRGLGRGLKAAGEGLGKVVLPALEEITRERRQRETLDVQRKQAEAQAAYQQQTFAEGQRQLEITTGQELDTLSQMRDELDKSSKGVKSWSAVNDTLRQIASTAGLPYQEETWKNSYIEAIEGVMTAELAAMERDDLLAVQIDPMAWISRFGEAAGLEPYQEIPDPSGDPTISGMRMGPGGVPIPMFTEGVGTKIWEHRTEKERESNRRLGEFGKNPVQQIGNILHGKAQDVQLTIEQEARQTAAKLRATIQTNVELLAENILLWESEAWARANANERAKSISAGAPTATELNAAMTNLNDDYEGTFNDLGALLKLVDVRTDTGDIWWSSTRDIAVMNILQRLIDPGVSVRSDDVKILQGLGGYRDQFKQALAKFGDNPILLSEKVRKDMRYVALTVMRHHALTYLGTARRIDVIRNRHNMGPLYIANIARTMESNRPGLFGILGVDREWWDPRDSAYYTWYEEEAALGARYRLNDKSEIVDQHGNVINPDAMPDDFSKDLEDFDNR